MAEDAYYETEEHKKHENFSPYPGILALIPLALLTDAIVLHPNSYGENSAGELIYLACGIPILILNLWAWGYPRLIEVLFLGKNNVDEPPAGQSGSGNPQ